MVGIVDRDPGEGTMTAFLFVGETICESLFVTDTIDVPQTNTQTHRLSV